MDLDALKKSWNTLQHDAWSFPPAPQITDLLRQPSKNPVARMKRNLWWDFFLSMIALGYLGIFYLLRYDGRLWIASVFLFISALPACIYFFRKARLLNDMLHPGWQVRKNFEKQLTTLQQYVRWYLLAATLFFPLLTLLLYALVSNSHPALLANRRIIFYWLSSGNVVTTMVIIAAVTLVFHFASKWYIHKLYGAHIRKLADLVKEMKE
jgi:hypothetical protein